MKHWKNTVAALLAAVAWIGSPVTPTGLPNAAPGPTAAWAAISGAIAVPGITSGIVAAPAAQSTATHGQQAFNSQSVVQESIQPGASDADTDQASDPGTASAQPQLLPQPAPAPAAKAAATAETSSSSGQKLAVTAAPGSQDLGGYVDAALLELSGEPGFTQWTEASRSIYPLGPGTHSWLVLLQTGSRELGYLVVGSTTDGGYRLLEYGQGSYPLFSMNTLYQALVQRELIPESLSAEAFAAHPPFRLTRWYVPPFQAVWLVDPGNGDPILYLDAKTGQELPDLQEWTAHTPDNTGETLATGRGSAKPRLPGSIARAAEREPFDPFAQPTWLKGTPLGTLSFGEWASLQDREETEITYAGRWFGGLALFPLAVSGYHQWSSEGPFIRVEHDGSRFLPYEDAERSGHFYANTHI